MSGNHPVLGQFFSPDPFISDPTSTMGYNCYAYCNYNPLKYTDPSGYVTRRPPLELDPPLIFDVPWQCIPGNRVGTSGNSLEGAFNSSHTFVPGTNGGGFFRAFC